MSLIAVDTYRAAISDKTLVSLAKHIQKALQPEELDSEGDAAKVGRISQSALENAINAVADRHNYGVDWTEKVLAHLCIWKWEVKRGKFHLLPKNTQDKFEARIAERQEVCIVHVIYRSMAYISSRRRNDCVYYSMNSPNQRRIYFSNLGEDRRMKL